VLLYFTENEFRISKSFSFYDKEDQRREHAEWEVVAGYREGRLHAI